MRWWWPRSLVKAVDNLSGHPSWSRIARCCGQHGSEATAAIHRTLGGHEVSNIARGDIDAETGGGRWGLLGGCGGELGVGEVEDGVVRLRDVADGDRALDASGAAVDALHGGEVDAGAVLTGEDVADGTNPASVLGLGMAASLARR